MMVRRAYHSREPLRPVHALLVLFFTATVVVPLAMLVLRLFEPGAFAVLSTDSFALALGNTLLAAFLGAAVSTMLAFVAAFSMARSTVRHRGLWTSLLTMPMLMPSIAHGLGVVYLFGSNGIVTNAVGAAWDVYGLPGILIGSVLYAFPPAFLLLSDAFRYECAAPYEAAEVMGLPSHAQFRAITVPLLAKPLLSAFFSSFALIATDYGVALSVGGKFTTLAVLMYNNVAGSLDIASGAGIGSVLLLPSFAAFLVDAMVPGMPARGGARRFRAPSTRLHNMMALTFRSVLAVFLLLPLVAFGLVAFVMKWPIDLTPTIGNVERALTFGLGSYLFNSLVIALCVTILGVAIAWLAGYVSARCAGLFSRVVHFACLLTLAIPGLVLGVSYMSAFVGTPLYRTIALLVAVNIVHFLCNPYLLARNALMRIDVGIEGTAAVFGIPRIRLVLDVFVRQTWGTVCEMAAYLFSNAMVTISAVSFLAGVSTMPLSLLINDFESQSLVECSAVVALVILMVNLVSRGLLSLASGGVALHRFWRRKE